MRKSILLLIFGALLLTACKTSVQNAYNPKNTMTVVFYNVENLFDTIDNPETEDDEFTPEGKKKWNTARYNKKLKDLSWVTANININELPEIIGLAEVENKQVVEDLARQDLLKKGKYVVVHEEGDDVRGIDLALMYRKDALKNVSHESLKVELTEKSDYKPRDILYVKGTADGQNFHIFVNHWKSRRGGQAETEQRRIDAAKRVREKVNDITEADPLAKIIVMGDMNDEPSNKSLNEVLFATNRTSGVKLEELYNLMYDKHLNGQGTYNYRGDWNMLDNLIVSQTLMQGKGYTVTPDGGEIFFDRKILYDNPKVGYYTPSRTYGRKYYGGFSDHLPVYFMMRNEK